MKNHKQLLADFYLALLNSTEPDQYVMLKNEVVFALGFLIKENPIELERIFKKMALEDKK
jgi:hypothetical protein